MKDPIQIINLAHLLTVTSSDCGERFVPVDTFDTSLVRGESEHLKVPESTKELIFYVRSNVAERLSQANAELRRQKPHYRLKIYYGYRPLWLQQSYFEEVRQKLLRGGERFQDEHALLERIHRSVALPSVAGHPTGGAVDLTIIDLDQNRDLDMGTTIHDIQHEAQMSWFYDKLSSAQRSARELLLEVMTAQGFAPFWGEWWHYSFGDKEWAAYYRHRHAIYDQVDSNSELFTGL